jgi:hypothetical protein
MPITTFWCVDKRVIYSVFVGETDHEAMQKQNNMLQQMLNEGTPPMYLINDFTNQTKQFNDMKSIRDSMDYLRSFDTIVSFGWESNKLMEFFVTFTTQFFGLTTKTVADFDAARTLLQQHDPSLNFGDFDPQAYYPKTL